MKEGRDGIRRDEDSRALTGAETARDREAATIIKRASIYASFQRMNKENAADIQHLRESELDSRDNAARIHDFGIKAIERRVISRKCWITAANKLSIIEFGKNDGCLQHLAVESEKEFARNETSERSYSIEPRFKKALRPPETDQRAF